MSWPRVFVNVVFLSIGAAVTWVFLNGRAPQAASPVSRPVPGSVETAPVGAIQRAFEEWSADPALGGALIGFCVLDENGEIEYASPLAWKALCPASALKTVTTAAAFDLLGQEYRFETAISAASKPSAAGVIAGNLVLVGGGDPTLSTTDLDVLAADLVKGGLKRVEGKVIADASVFRGQPVSDHWNWGDIGNAYGAGAFGVNLDHNRLELSFTPGSKLGDTAKLLPVPGSGKDTRWLNTVTTGPEGSGDQVVVYSQPYGTAITLQGTVPMGRTFTITGSLPDPPATAARLLTAALEKAGVVIGGKTFPAAAASEKLAVHRSAPLPEIIDHLHRVSDNLEAQCLFLTMGRAKKEDSSKALRGYWEGRGISFEGLRLIDGSGLARANMIRPVDLAKVNHVARRGPHGDRFRQSLSTYVGGRVSSKLGAMSGVKTDVGFITTSDGRELTFCLMANGLDPALGFWPLRDKLLLAVASAGSE
ncbi:D-alanyl-D-alanine carboxypeptidase/D-alanyl-D-alanine-endopeptidase [Luteolibacter flavescens]|uniref:D-alanyl-D-alanine carboxypeptidase/D-alanyl-D-alanine-endopeptidase n=1 Tax=Luteolibacter flavescens TaxID=1859460 RepID=A0ABT3FSS7_9BACT|nr:D-alanyl-D-alanine carboxypeptidase/D-alanyl-D-alanine-endopeptidase [Luteolibacter flavescens]MCW1886623.1 D-alanyl-D-alanine carboxypeptidase/D-alanyl-D-alanine-endopeptidase [Luteolibacter flavescens]